MANPNPNQSGLTPWKKGESGNPYGRPKKLLTQLKNDCGLSKQDASNLVRTMLMMDEETYKKKYKNKKTAKKLSVHEVLAARAIEKAKSYGEISKVMPLYELAFGKIDTRQIAFQQDETKSDEWNWWNFAFMQAIVTGNIQSAEKAADRRLIAEAVPTLTREEKDELDADGQKLMLNWRLALAQGDANSAKSFYEQLETYKLSKNKNTAFSFNWDDNALYNMIYRKHISWRNQNILYIGSRQSAKTEDANLHFIKKIHTLSGRIVALTRATQTDANKGLYKSVVLTIKRIGLEEEFIFRSAPKMIISKKTGSIFITKGFLESVKGQPVTDIFCDEFDEVPNFEIWNRFILTARGGDKTKPVEIRCCMNPVSLTAWQVQTYFDNPKEHEKEDGTHIMMPSKSPEWAIIHTTYKDNQYIDAASKQRLDTLHLIAPDLVDSQCKGLLTNDRTGGELINTWNDRRNIAKGITWDQSHNKPLTLLCDWNERQHTVLVADVKVEDGTIYYDIIASFRLYGLDLADYPDYIHAYLDYIGYVKGGATGKDFNQFVYDVAKNRATGEKFNPYLWFKHLPKFKTKTISGKKRPLRLVGDVTGVKTKYGKNDIDELLNALKRKGYDAQDFIRYDRKREKVTTNEVNSQAIPYLCTVVKGDVRIKSSSGVIYDVRFRVNEGCTEVIQDLSKTQKKEKGWDAKPRKVKIDGVVYDIAGHNIDTCKYGVIEEFRGDYDFRYK